MGQSIRIVCTENTLYLAFSYRNKNRKRDKMADLKMAGLLLLVTMMAMNVSSQPIDSGEMTSGGDGFLDLLKKLAQVVKEWAIWQFLPTEAPEAPEAPEADNNSSYTKVLVVTGLPRTNAKKTELIPLIPSSQNECPLPDFPISLDGAVGFTTAQGPVVCGGYNNKDCFILKGQDWTHWASMITERLGAAVLKLNDDKALILGGWNRNDGDLSSSEILSSNGVEDAEINFPVTFN